MHRSLRPAAGLLAIAALAGALPALELRLDAFRTAGDFDYTYTETDASDVETKEEGDDSFDSGYAARFNIVGIWGQHFQFSFLFGGYLVKEETDNATFKQAGIDLGLGLGWQFDSGIFVGAEIFGGGGTATAGPITASNDEEFDASDFGLISGLIGRAGYHFDCGITLFAEVGSLATSYVLTNDDDVPGLTDTDIELELTATGIAVGGGIGYRF